MIVIQPLSFHGPNAGAAKHDRSPKQDALREAIPKEPNAEEEGDEFAHIEGNGDAQGRGARAE